jgi:hypothetical protein
MSANGYDEKEFWGGLTGMMIDNLAKDDPRCTRCLIFTRPSKTF